jgi:hypothetical protein
MLRSRQEHIDSIGGLQEAYRLRIVASNQRHDDNLSFLALEVIDSS